MRGKGNFSEFQEVFERSIILWFESVKELLFIWVIKPCTEPWLGGPSWLEHRPVHRKVEGSIPRWGAYRKQSIHVSLSHQCCSLSLSLSLSPPTFPFLSL